MDNYSSVNEKNRNIINYGNHRSVKTEVVAVLEAIFTDRKMKLIESYSRAVKKHDIHELMITDQNPSPGSELNRMNAIAFIEVRNGGLIVSGDKVYHNEELFGVLAGYDMNHMPNHMNIIVKKDSLNVKNMSVGDILVFRMD